MIAKLPLLDTEAIHATPGANLSSAETTRLRGAFIRTRSWPAANENVYRTLKEQLPTYDIDLIEIESLLKQRPLIVALNVLFVVWYYGLDIVRRRRKFKDCFFRTPYIFHTIKRLVSQQIAQKQYSFSFQMQSLFDASTEGTPHFLYTDHTHLANLYYANFDKRKLYSEQWIALERTIYQNTIVNFCRSSNIRRSLIDQYDSSPDKTVCVYAGSNTEQHPVDFNENKYTSKQILFVGMDWERKGGPVLLEAFKLVIKHHPDAELMIVGCTPQVDVPQCKVVARVPIDQVSMFYEEAAIFCLPTKLEPFGVVFVEAMNHRLPVVATNVGAVPDFILNGETGYIVEPDNATELAQALIALLDDPEKCRTLGNNAYMLVKKRYSWENAVEAMQAHILATIK